MLETTKRKPNTMYVLLRWPSNVVTMELKSFLPHYKPVYVVLCDDQPKHVLEKMLAMAEET